MSFKEGDVVTVLGNNILMIVEDVRQDDLVSVFWFDQARNVHREAFYRDVLQKWQMVED
jgi:uncharacterized protein YodC (DUF2158 family)